MARFELTCSDTKCNAHTKRI